jgi:hypothetical protein
VAQIIDDWTPEVIWNLLDKMGTIRSGASVLEMIGAEGTSILLICGDREARTFRRASKRIDALISAGVLTFEVLPGLDHSLFSAKSRRDTKHWLDGFVSALGARDTLARAGLVASPESTEAVPAPRVSSADLQGGEAPAGAVELLARCVDPKSTA